MSDSDADADTDGASEETTDERPSDEAVVQAASDAAEGLVLSRYKQSEIDDLDVTVSFEDGLLEVDVYLNVPDDADPNPERVVEDAVRAAEAAVDELFAEARGRSES